MDRSQELPTRMAAVQSLQEGVVLQNLVQQSYQQPDLSSRLNPLNYFIHEDYSSNPLSSVPQQHYSLPDSYSYSNTTASASSAWNSPNPFYLLSDTAPLPTTNPHSDTLRPAANPPPHSSAPTNASIPDNTSPRLPKKFKCCDKIMRSDNMIVHLRNVHRESILPGTRLKNWVHDHPNCMVFEV